MCYKPFEHFACDKNWLGVINLHLSERKWFQEIMNRVEKEITIEWK